MFPAHVSFAALMKPSNILLKSINVVSRPYPRTFILRRSIDLTVSKLPKTILIALLTVW